MKLIKYLNEHFITKWQLLNLSKVTEQELETYQKCEVMPKCSYKLDIDILCDSFLSLHQEKEEVEYYAKGYVSWLTLVHSLKTKECIYKMFSQRYVREIESLRLHGHSSNNPKLNADIELHIEEEWQHFLNGTYGLCTKTGLPEDIGAKEFAITEINELTVKSEIDQKNTKKLINAVNLLDTSSSLFAPHERSASSRKRLVEQVRSKYSL